MELVWDITVYFALFSVCGWICESIFCSIQAKKPVNRGFLNGPVCPVYGFGGLIVVYWLGPVRNNLLLLFLLGMAATTILEYITSYIMEKLFHTRWWDYTGYPGNIRGRVCLPFSLMFGGLSVIAVKLLYPPFTAMVQSLPLWLRGVIAWSSVALFGLDTAYTARGILILNGKLDELKALTVEIRRKLEQLQGEGAVPFKQRLEQFRQEQWEKTGALHGLLEQQLAKLEELRDATASRFQHRRLIQAFPNMKSVRNQETLAEIKERIVLLRRKRGKKREK